jgi:hypothetical protein
MLPNMDDLLFWDLNGEKKIDSDEYSDNDEFEDCPYGFSNHESGNETDDNQSVVNAALLKESVVNAALLGEAVESTIALSRNIRRRRSKRAVVNAASESLGRELNHFDNVSYDSNEENLSKPRSLSSRGSITDSAIYRENVSNEGELYFQNDNNTLPKDEKIIRNASESSISTNSQSSSTALHNGKLDNKNKNQDLNSKTLEQLGNTAYQLGELLRKNGIDKKAETIAASVASYAQPYTIKVQEAAIGVGLSAIQKLGLSPDKDENPDIPMKQVRSKASITWNMLGVNVSTKPPSNLPEPPRSLIKKRSRANLKDIRLSETVPSNSVSASELPQFEGQPSSTTNTAHSNSILTNLNEFSVNNMESPRPTNFSGNL